MGLKDKRIAVISENRYEWAISYLSVITGTGVVVPLDRQLPEREVENCIRRAEVSAIIYSNKLSETITETLNNILKANILISDTDKFISISGPLKKKYLKEEISETILKYINDRKNVILKDKKINITKDKTENKNIFISPIISNGDAIGAIIIISDKELTSNNLESVSLLSKVLAKHIES